MRGALEAPWSHDRASRYPSWTPDNSGFFYTHLPPKPADLPEAAWPGLQTLVHFVIGAHEEPVVVTPPSHDPMECATARAAGSVCGAFGGDKGA